MGTCTVGALALIFASSYVSSAQNSPRSNGPSPPGAPSDDTPVEAKDQPGEPKPPKAAAVAGTFVLLRTGQSFVGGKGDEILKDIGSVLGASVLGDGKAYGGTFAGDGSAAKGVIESQQAHWALVSPAFYYTNKAALGISPLLETRPAGGSFERFGLLVASKGSIKELAGLEGKMIAAVNAADADYLNKVVFEQKVKPAWSAVTDISHSMLAIADGNKDAPAAVLLDAQGLTLFSAQPDLAEFFTLLWTSAELAPDMVVVVSARCGQKEREALAAGLRALASDAEHPERMLAFGTAAFGDVNHARLAAEELLLAAPPPVPAKENGQAK